MKPTASPNLWRPLRVTIFRNLLIADVISDSGEPTVRHLIDAYATEGDRTKLASARFDAR
jgi:hypothetical protein